MLSQKQLQLLVQKISVQNFGMPFEHTAVFNKRLKTTGGRYLLNTHDIEFNPKMVDLSEFIGIIKHELVHYHLHQQQKGYRHCDKEFKQLLADVKGLRYAPNIATADSSILRYICENGHIIIRKRRFDISKYRCAKCGSKILFDGMHIEG
ncbi:SprT family protein [Leuconostoc palmae]|uniref:SprT family protein n=1 Tax=Leuconostoc palmae TaxID=501487 RepID=UPI001C7D3441|nr:SprT family protein [Leuconostoc palmae]